jgi:hypothetical protein
VRATEQQRWQAAGQPGDVEQRGSRHRHPVGGVHAQVRDLAEHVHEQVAVGQHGALGPAGGARGVHDEGGGVLVHLDVQRLGARRGQRLLVVPADGEDGAHAGRLPAGLGRDLGERGVHHEGHRAAVAEHVGDLVGDQPEVHRDDDRAQPHPGEVGLPHLQAVEPEDGDAVARVHPAVGQGAGQPGHPLVELGVAAPAALEPQRDGVRRPPRPPRQLVAGRHAAAHQPGDVCAHGASCPPDCDGGHAGWGGRGGQQSVVVDHCG